jgi:outer membrane autotransporter protein
MKRNQILTLLVLMMFSLPTFTFAQLVKIGAGGGLTQILGPESLTNEITTAYGWGGAGFSTEWNAGLIGKLDIPMLPITPRGFIFYHSFSASKEFPEVVINPKIETNQTILEIGLGAQYNFIPAPLGFDPYIALDISLNTFGNYTTNVNGEEFITDGFSRFGGGIGVGTEISIIPVVNLDLYLSYKMFNLTGKEDGEETVSAVTLDAFIIFNFL